MPLEPCLLILAPGQKTCHKGPRSGKTRSGLFSRLRRRKDAKNSRAAAGHPRGFRAESSQFSHYRSQFRVGLKHRFLKIVLQRGMLETEAIKRPGKRLKLSQDRRVVR